MRLVAAEEAIGDYVDALRQGRADTLGRTSSRSAGQTRTGVQVPI